jgi:hypothetical protein
VVPDELWGLLVFILIIFDPKVLLFGFVHFPDQKSERLEQWFKVHLSFVEIVDFDGSF